MWLRNLVTLFAIFLLSVAMQPQSINGVPNQALAGAASGTPATQCSQLPCVVASTQVTGQSAAINTNPYYTPTVAGTYQFVCSMYITTAGTAGTMQCGFNWKSGVTGGLQSSASSVTTNMTTAGNVTQVVITAHLDGVSGVALFTNYTGATGTPVYGIDAAVMRIN